MRKYLKLLSLFIVAMVIFTGCVQDNPTSTPSANPQSTPQAPQQTPVPSPSNYKIGDTAKVGDWEITVKSFEAKEYFEDPSDPENEKKFVLPTLDYFFLVHVEVKNNGTVKKAFCSPTDELRLNIYYDEFNSFLPIPDLDESVEGNLYNVEIEPASTKDGFIAFSMLEGVATSGKLKLQLNIGTATLGIFDASEFTWTTPEPEPTATPGK